MAFAMYSKIPMPPADWEKENMKYALCFFPWVGLAVGAVSAVLFWLLQQIGAGSMLRAAVLTAVPVLVTGGIHLDGYLDTMDALSSWREKQRRLEILKDPHTGAFAVMGCVAYLLLTFALWTQPQGSGRWLTVQMMAVGFVLSRSMSALSVVSFPCAKSSGLVHSFSSAAQKRNVRIAAAVFAAACVLLWLWIHPLLGAVLTGCCLLNFWYYYRMSQKQFGGITGDLAGYFLQLNEIIILLASVLYTLSAR